MSRAEKITGGLLEIPTPTSKKKAALKAKATPGEEGGDQVTDSDEQPGRPCARWPECGCREFCDYWNGPGLTPVEDA